MKWQDTTKNGVAVSSRLDLSKVFSVVVHHHIDHPPEVWLGSCYSVVLASVPLKSVTLVEARKEWLAYVQQYIELRLALIVTARKAT